MGISAGAALAISAVVSAGSAIYAAKNKPKISAPKQPTNVGTGEIIKTKAQSLDEKNIKDKRDTTNKTKLGNTQFQVELKNKPKTGINTTSGSGLNI